MDNIISYAEKTLATFQKLPFSAVDSLILSQFSYFRFPKTVPLIREWGAGVRIADLFRAEYFDEMFRYNWDADSSRRLFTAMAASPRFRDIRVFGYTEHRDRETEKQFAAVSFKMPDNMYYIAFRGTDSTLIGWKEDFNMAFQYPVPAQADAVRYLKKSALQCRGEIRVGGHSKGGNLAVFAAANSDENLKKRIFAIYSHDGPGFLSTVLESEKFKSVSDKINKTVPQSSLIGMLLEQQENYKIVKSNRFSVWQHDPFSWLVENGGFVPVSELTSGAKYLDGVLNDWVAALSVEEREKFVDLLFSLVDMENVKTTAELKAQWQKNIPLALRTVSGFDKQTKEFASKTVKALFSLGWHEIWE